MNEASLRKENSFITLTYNDENVVWGGQAPTLVPKDLTDFWKRLRKEYGNVRYFACGEYGERTSRPHYHAIVFGLDFSDKEFYSRSKGGDDYHISTRLNGVWGHGNVIIGDVSFESAAYVARYIVDKKTGPLARVYQEQGIEPPFVRMSRKPGIGRDWLKKYKTDVYNHDKFMVRGVATKAPRYYDKLLELENPEQMAIIKEARLKRAEERYWKQQENGGSKPSVQERVKKAAEPTP